MYNTAMIILSSPAKSLDMSEGWKSFLATEPKFLDQSEELIDIMKRYSAKDLEKVLKVSAKVAQVNKDRFKVWEKAHTSLNSKPAVMAYNGTVYKQLQTERYGLSEKQYASEHLYILSALYGLLSAFDLIQAYRLEMNTSLKDSNVSSLYDYWADVVTEHLLTISKGCVIVNLASQTYSKVIHKEIFSDKFIDIEFKQKKDGRLRSVGVLSKAARGMMINYLVLKKATGVEDLLKFDLGGYSLYSETGSRIIFARDL